MAYQPKEKILTKGQLCEWWGITGEQVDKLRREADLPYIELVRGTYVFRESSLMDWLRVREYPKEGLNSRLKVAKEG